MTPDGAANPQEVLAALAVRRAITTVPASVARMIPTGVVGIPLRGADPSAIRLVGHTDRRNPLVMAVVAFARNLTENTSGVSG